MSNCSPIPVIGRVGGSRGYDRKGCAVRGAFDSEAAFIVGIIFPFERNIAMLLDVGG